MYIIVDKATYTYVLKNVPMNFVHARSFLEKLVILEWPKVIHLGEKKMEWMWRAFGRAESKTGAQS